MESTLVLNASFEPLGIISARSAVTKLLNGKAIAVDNSPKNFNAEHDSLPIPYVIQMTYMVKRKRHGKFGFSRRGVLVRDNHLCVYCGKRGTTIDHVIPRALGGVNSYENCVTACVKCNSKKANITLEQLGWSLKFEPYTPSPYLMLLQYVTPGSELYNSWNEYVHPWTKVMA